MNEQRTGSKKVEHENIETIGSNNLLSTLSKFGPWFHTYPGLNSYSGSARLLEREQANELLDHVSSLESLHSVVPDIL